MKKHLKYLTASLAMSTALGSMALAEDIKIGMVVTLSGPPAALGQQIVDGFQLALDEKDGMLGGQKIELIVEDDELKPDVALLKATSLVERDEVDFVVGTVFSNMLQAIFKPVVQSETFLVSPNAGPSTFAGRNCNPYFFVTSYQNNQNAEISGMIANEEGFESVFTMVPNYQAGRDNIEGFKQTFEGTVTDEVFTPLGHQDFSAELARISTSDADAVFTFMPGGMGVRLVNQFANAGLSENTKFMSVFTTDETTLPGQKDAAVGFLAAGSWAPDLANDANTAFVSAFEAKYGYVPGSYAMQAYDAASLIDSAVAKTDGDLSDKDAVRAALKEADFTSLRGDFSFNNNHYPVQDFHMLNVIKRDDGNYQTSFVRTIAEDYSDSFHQECKM
ncbi:Leucine-, isoleucine-, valine-, threonine-, and alanine-binding protein [Sulfitobacter sp. DSM 110093]|uniref:ABC transporter substrate-binding protein n=1 Tax=Sulfitobacter sp. DSM 110093 TaxID=2883127 RepID=UPI001FAD1934|nr:ABC transporter substrate-binding protein [Sulfitobacter sp. DSM 110093]UOA32782.1 Leucine-, isoleucine-, valine-, threonine-, and alanine-binding protein [Sulfitobacter sp. DSM 110093]